MALQASDESKELYAVYLRDKMMIITIVAVVVLVIAFIK